MELIRKLSTRLSKKGWLECCGLFLCPYCLQEVERRLSQGKIQKSCGCIQYKLMAETNKGKKRSEKTKQKIKEKRNMWDSSGMKGKKHTKEYKQNMSKIMKEKFINSENHPMFGRKGALSGNWNNGSSFELYGIEFNKELKQIILERDNYTCQCPDCENISVRLAIHHIDYNKNNNNPKNLITLCNSCHSKTIGKNNREYYIKYYSNIVGIVL